MSDLEKILKNLVRRLEKVGRQLEISVIMEHLMVLQLDGRLEISNETMRLYLAALTGSAKKVEVFQKHVVEQYYS